MSRADPLHGEKYLLVEGSDTASAMSLNEMGQLVAEAHRDDLGVLVLRQHPRVAFGMQQHINLWLRERIG